MSVVKLKSAWKLKLDTMNYDTAYLNSRFARGCYGVITDLVLVPGAPVQVKATVEQSGDRLKAGSLATFVEQLSSDTLVLEDSQQRRWEVKQQMYKHWVLFQDGRGRSIDYQYPIGGVCTATQRIVRFI
eukprot:m.285682 g.285682  ORF g.285682 m.285682 type:complete len:129 (+) comp17774_c0_seq30:863-1249(+)